jgi:hypothetical protein
MLQRSFHILIILAGLIPSLFGWSAGVLCISSDETWIVHFACEQSPECSEACSLATSCVSTDSGFCTGEKCRDIQIGNEVIPTSSLQIDVEALLVSSKSAVIHTTILPVPKTGTFLSGRSWADLHTPPFSPVAVMSGIRQI